MLTNVNQYVNQHKEEENYARLCFSVEFYKFEDYCSRFCHIAPCQIALWANC
jgi:hypothetical protein